jgi:hypothetical protein
MLNQRECGTRPGSDRNATIGSAFVVASTKDEIELVLRFVEFYEERLRSMKTICIGVTCALVAVTACSPVQWAKEQEVRALQTVSSHISAPGEPPRLRADANPWGQGMLVFTAEAAREEDVLIWFCTTEGSFALDQRSSQRTPGLPLLDEAADPIQRKPGLDGIPKSEVYARVFRAIRSGTYAAETP